MKNPDSNRPARLGRWLPSVAAFVVIGLTLSLGNWQLRRAEEKRAVQGKLDAAARQAPVAITAAPVNPAQLHRVRATVRGQWVPKHTVFIDNRTHNAVAGFHVVTPIKIDGSSMHLLVIRGWVAQNRQERTRLPTVPIQTGTIDVAGLAISHLDKVLELKAAPAPGPGDRLWQNLDLERFVSWSGLQIQPIVLRQSVAVDATDTLVRQWPQVGKDIDKHLGYAAQWFAMALTTLVLWGYFTFIRRPKKPTHD
ncbi:MAG: SURF1 family protein [Quisquiliibacterium sp.]